MLVPRPCLLLATIHPCLHFGFFRSCQRSRAYCWSADYKDDPSTLRQLVQLVDIYRSDRWLSQCEGGVTSTTSEYVTVCIDGFVPLRCCKPPAFRPLESLASNRRAASECKTAVYSFITSYENNFVSNDNIGVFYRYARKILCTKSSVNPLLSIVTTPSLAA